MQNYYRVHVQLGKKDRQQLGGMLTEGLESALHEKPRPGKRRALDVGQSQRIIAMVCGSPPQGRGRWSVRLIAEEAVKRRLAPRVGRETIRILLQGHELKPWREKKLVHRGTE